MFNKCFNFSKGYVIIGITGAQAARFINICVRRGIAVSDIRAEGAGSYTARIRLADFFLIRHAAGKTKVKIRIVRRGGAAFAKRFFRARRVFFSGAVFAALFFAVTSQFIWVVQIDGVYETSREQIIETLGECGIKPGAFKHTLPPADEVKSRLINETGTLSWAWVYIEGAKARVEVYERRLMPETEDTSEPCDIIAARDAFIERIDVKSGERIAENGSVVSAGDVLISGTVPVYREGEEERYMQVHADGVIKAVTYRSKTTEQSLYHESREKTGREKNYYSIEAFGKLFKLFFNESPGFEHYGVSDERHELTLPFFGYSGLCLNIRRFSEEEVKTEPIPEDAAALIARERLEEEIAKELLKNPVLLDSSLEYEKTGGGKINVQLKTVFYEDIGIKSPINKE